MSKAARLGIAAALVLVGVIGYGIMRVLVYVLPQAEDTTVSHFILMSLMIALGLSVPYIMLKLGFWEAHLNNGRERGLRLKDIPKDEDQLAKEDA